MSQLTTPREVIKALGGIKAVAQLTGRGYFAAANWNRFPTFPRDTFLVMTRALAKQDLRAPPSLWGQVNGATPQPRASRSPRRKQQAVTSP